MNSRINISVILVYTNIDNRLTLLYYKSTIYTI